MAMTMHTTVGNPKVIYYIVARVSKRMRTLADLCLMLVDVDQRDDSITDTFM